MKNNVIKFSKKLLISFIFVVLFKSCCLAYEPEAIKAYNEGIEETKQENFKKAISLFKKTVKIEPSFIDAYYNLGIIHEFIGNNDKALNAFESVLSYNPEDYEVIYKIALIYHNMGDEKKAVTYAEQIPQENPNFKKIAELFEEKNNNSNNVVEVKNESEEEEFFEEEIIEEGKNKTYWGFKGPAGVVKDSKGNLYVANFSNNSISFISIDGKQETLAEGGIINGPVGLALDEQDNLYVANYDSNEIVFFPANGEEPKVLPISVDKPYFLMIDNDLGVLYVTEHGNNSVSEHKLF